MPNNLRGVFLCKLFYECLIVLPGKNVLKPRLAKQCATFLSSEKLLNLIYFFVFVNDMLSFSSLFCRGWSLCVKMACT